MPPLEALLDELFAGSRPPLYAEMAAWLRSARRMRVFVEQHRSKIRARIKSADVEGLLDLRAELQAAALLIGEPRFDLAYEGYVAARTRGPDFTVTFRTHTRFHVEVRRLRRVEADALAPEARVAKLQAVLCDKVGQLPAGALNFLWLAAEAGEAPDAVAQVALQLQQLAAHKQEALFVRYGFSGGAGFLRHFARLSGILLLQPQGASLWLSPQARHKPTPALAAALQRAAAG